MDPKAEIIKANKKTFDLLLDEWGFVKDTSLRDNKRGQIILWLNNFAPSEIEDAILLLSKIQYKDNHLIQDAITHLAKEIKNIFHHNLDKVKFFPLGESPSSSGGMYLYEFRKELGLSEDNFPYSPFNENLNHADAIVFFDDIIGSGNQAMLFAKNKLQHIEIDTYYFSIFAYKDGLDEVRNSKYFKNVICEHVFSDEERAFHDISYVFKNDEIRSRLKALCEKYGKLLYPEHSLGYDNSQSLLVFPHNTPNNTLPIFWASENNEKVTAVRWNPIWERKKKILEKIKSSVPEKSQTVNVIVEDNRNATDDDIKFKKYIKATKVLEVHPLNSQRVEIGSPKGIERFKELYQFAYETNGLNMTSDNAKEWALANLNDFKIEDISRFKELSQFAFEPYGLNMTSDNAKKWALNQLKKNGIID